MTPDTTAAPDRYAVIGNPIAHSKSPQIHAAFAQATGERIAYERVLAPRDGFRDTVLRFAAEGGRGCNVTLPFKEEAAALAVRRTPRAYAAGACNTLSFRAGGVHGDNTDGAGLTRDILDNLGWPLAGARVLVLGAGGAARGIVPPLLEAGVARIDIANRTHAKAVHLAQSFAADGEVRATSRHALADEAFDLVINATSAGNTASDPAAIEWPELRFGRPLCAYDLAYGAAARPFLDWARARGAHATSDGLGMLVEQAAESFYVWRGVRPSTHAVLAALRAPT